MDDKAVLGQASHVLEDILDILEVGRLHLDLCAVAFVEETEHGFARFVGEAQLELGVWGSKGGRGFPISPHMFWASVSCTLPS